jgi:hypothetical protein
MACGYTAALTPPALFAVFFTFPPAFACAALPQGTGKLEQVGAEDWTPQTIDSWRHSNLVGVLDPWFVVFKWNPKLWYKVTREIVTLERMHQAFDKGLMQYGLMRATKPAKVVQEASSGSTSSSSSSSSQESEAAVAAAASV